MVRPSFRDPAGCTWVGPDVVHRAAWEDSPGTPEAQAALETLLRQFQAEGKWIAAKPIDPSTLPAYLQGECPLPKRAWEHPRIFFPSYAHEWSPGMVHCAAALTLELNKRLLEIGWELKDATPSNILFEGPNPIFVDHLSPAPRKPGQMGWTAYGQFIRTFIIPLCLNRLNGMPVSWLYLARRDGLPPEDAIHQLTFFNLLRPTVVALITFPAFMSRFQSTTPMQGLRLWKTADESIGIEITTGLIRGLQKRLLWVEPTFIRSTLWSNYDHSGESYSSGQLDAKVAFIQEALEISHPGTVLDLGCNTGRYSRMAARLGSSVVAIDSDEVCINKLWLQARSEHLNINPLVMDLGRPTPAIGWMNDEQTQFTDRGRGRFDMVLGLALIHHLLVRERIPLNSIISYLSKLTTKWAIIEWVGAEDKQFIRLAGPNAHYYSAITEHSFEASISELFSINRSTRVPHSGRVLYLLKKRTSDC